MFKRSLYRQSCKSNGIMWIIITAAVCFMLACVMIISGGGSIGKVKDSIQTTIIQGEIESQIERRSISYYDLQKAGMHEFDKAFYHNFTTSETEMPNKINESYSYAIGEVQKFVLAKAQSIDESNTMDSLLTQEMMAVTLTGINPPDTQNPGHHLFDSVYQANNEVVPEEYDIENIILNISNSQYLQSEERMNYIQNRSQYSSAIFLALNMTSEETVELMLQELSKFGVTKEKYDSFNYTYEEIKHTATTTVISFQSRFNFEMSILNKKLEKGDFGEVGLDSTQQNYLKAVESMNANLTGDLTESLLSSLPQTVAQALEEVGQMDLYSLIVGSIFFKMAGLLLPIIFMIMASNNLIAGQVDSGSMAYIISTSTKRKQVTFTQALYLISSLFVMFLLTTVTGLICLASLKNVETTLTYGKLVLLNLGAFITMFAMSGICYLASCWFDRSKRSMAIGGGISMFFLVATMLGLFGSSVLPSVVRLKALNSFNYVSIISLFDVISILEGTTTFIWKFAILIVIGIVGYVVGAIKFKKKDLPL